MARSGPWIVRYLNWQSKSSARPKKRYPWLTQVQELAIPLVGIVATHFYGACHTIHELLAFDAVARSESLTQAASTLCITVSAVSKQISNLEEFVGRQLLRK